MKKIISLFSAVAVVASMFAAFATTSFAETVAADSKPEIQGTVESVDGDGYAIMKFKLVNNEELSYKLNRGKVTSNGINAIQVKVTLDSTVFDTSETYISGGFTGTNTSGDNTANLTFVFAPTSVDTYMTNVPEYIFQIDALLNDGYTFENIPSSAVTFTASKVEYTSYAGVAPADGRTTYTIYNTADLAGDYPLTLGFTGTVKDDPIPDPEPDPEPLPADRAAAVSFAADENTYVEITKGDEVKNYFLPSNVKADATVYGLLKYTVDGTDVKSGDIFTIKAVDFTTKTATWSTNITVE